jgi:sugar fermentation stimulation protein A
MQFTPPLVQATLVRRYKRFLADVVLPDGTPATVSCPNTGAMLGLAAPGLTVHLSTHEGGGRKYRHALELVEVPALDGGAARVAVGINPQVPNTLVAAALAEGRLPELAGYPLHRREVPYGENSRIDFLLSEHEGAGGPDNAKTPRCYVEVKNVHLCRRPRLAEFPDSVTARGAKHLAELARVAEAGKRAVMLYIVQREDVDELAFAHDIDPTYALAVRHAARRGVEFLAWRCRVSPRGVIIGEKITVLQPSEA